MRSALPFLLLLSIAFVLCGCPYQSPAPLEDYPSVTVNADLLGVWHKPTYPADSTEITFSAKSDDEYTINATLPDELEEYRRYTFRGYFTYIKDGVLLNVEDDSSQYYFVAVWLDNNKLTLRPLSQDITDKQFTSPGEVRHFVEDMYANGKVKYDEDIKLDSLEKAK